MERMYKIKSGQGRLFLRNPSHCDMIFTSFPEGVLLRKGEPSFLLWESETPDYRQRKLRDENKSCGKQPAYISMIIRRY